MKNIVKRKEIFKGKLLNLSCERRRFPNGYVGDLEVIRHPGAVLVVPFLNKGKVVLIKQYRPVINTNIWELPAGTLDKKETPLACAKRELVEEIGYTAKNWGKIGYIYPAPGYTDEKILIYKASGLKKVSLNLQEDECITPKILSIKAVKGLFKSGKLIDAKTLCALKLAHVL